MRVEEWRWQQVRFFQNRYLVLENLKRELAVRGIAFTDLPPLLDRRSYLRFDGHFSEEGHRRVAADVLQVLAQQDGTRSRQPTLGADPEDLHKDR